jgi:hypothetical protein
MYSATKPQKPWGIQTPLSDFPQDFGKVFFILLNLSPVKRRTSNINFFLLAFIF